MGLESQAFYSSMLTGMQEEQTGSNHLESGWMCCPAPGFQCSTDPPLALVGLFLDRIISPSLAPGLPQGRVAASFLVNKQPVPGPVWPVGRTRRN